MLRAWSGDARVLRACTLRRYWLRACVRAWNAAWYDGAYLQVPVAHAVVVHILYSGDDLIHYVTCVLLRVLALVNDLERGEREEERRREEERERGRGGEGEGRGGKERERREGVVPCQTVLLLLP